MPDDARPFSNCLLDLAPPDIAWFRERSDIVLVPIGSCEQHGAHLPLGTDTITALEVSRRAAEKAEVPTLRRSGPATRRSTCGEPETGVGTITLRPSTFTELLYDIARSLIHHGWNKLVFVNGHGSNTKVIDPLLRRIKYETGAFVALYKPYAERYIGLLDDLLENPLDETPGLARLRARDLPGDGARRRAWSTWSARPRTARACRSGCRSRSSRPTAHRTWSSTATSTSSSRWITTSSRAPA